MFQQHLHHPIRITRRPDADYGIDLRTVRRWYAPEGDGQQGANNAGQGNTPAGGSSSAGTENTDHMIPLKRFNEVNEELKTLREKVQQDEAARQAAEQERLRKQGEFQTLAEQEKKRADDLAPKAARAAELEKLIAESNKARIDKLPEARRSLVPAGLPPEAVAAYLDANWTLLMGVAAPDLDGGAGGGSGGTGGTLTAEEKEIARKTGMTDEQFAAAKAKLPKR